MVYKNRLGEEKSPYLLQHASNPVDWYPWGEEAFAQAKKEDKPIFLSIGYSTCHWCHVMEKESFEDEEVAELLNRDYISIKVDREERPDIDHIYMTVCQALTGQGGWPLTVMMTPEKKPFFAGTYFPKRSQRGMPGMIELLNRISDVWQNERDKLLESGEKVTAAIRAYAKADQSGDLSLVITDSAYEQVAQQFDSAYGGFGQEPKFPRPHDFLFLLRYWKQSNVSEALTMVEKTLTAMHQGGIYDHLGFGFARYSVDREWLVPHFEKMLYDNALLAYAYLETYQATKKEKYARIAEEIFTYVLRDMTSPEGGFYSAEDADSEGREGRFYVWSPVEIEQVLGEEEGQLFCEVYDVTPDGNFEDGLSILNRIHDPLHAVAAREGMSEEEIEERLQKARAQLLSAREQRIHPHKDDKILTSWNGLMIAALAKGAQVLGKPHYAESAARAVQFIDQHVRRADGRLLARFRDGEAAFPGYVDDYAFYSWGLIELYEATGNVHYLEHALQETERMMDLFNDEEYGGLFFYGHDAEQLLTRQKEIYDGALPSGNSIAGWNLVRLAKMSGNEHLHHLAKRQLSAFARNVEQGSMAYTAYLVGLQLHLGATTEIVIVGDSNLPVVKEMKRIIYSTYLPDAVILFRDGQNQDKLAQFAPFTAEQHAPAGEARVYICKNHTCQAPLATVEELELELGK
ncbi:thioredoxin domain-containing protein [Mechercharimyces sp. CAU 1602]|uniref:thioredoxin domain-containing protein n=1 Tax=Mechercharimyces sp. CAU 1602 TaxID=2973933 RepID=UPI0021618970|nr:thioredoxin domain-containing protein [Mechercharimyces sp. CAU 1602]MCS1351742.1 thioredoxin domain-containing protein [Mechercharimyces sp. CAU 1602]